MADKTSGETRAAALNYVVTYKEPIIGGESTQRAARQVFTGLREWDISLENVSVFLFPANLAQAETTFQILQGRFTIKVGLGSASLVVSNPSWSETEAIKKVALALATALRSSGEIEFAKQQLTLEMHVTPAGRSVPDITAPLLPQKLARSKVEDLKACGLIVYRADASWHVDVSAMFPESLYIRLSHDFEPQIDFDTMASVLRQEQARLLETLALNLSEVG